MKRFFYLVISLALCVVLLSGFAPVYAEESTADTNTATTLTESTAPVITLPETTGDDVIDANYTFFGRLWEGFVDNLTAVGDAAILVLCTVFSLFSKKKFNVVEGGLKSAVGNTATVTTSQNAVVQSVNGWADVGNEMAKSLKDFKNTEEDKNGLLGAVLAQNAAILDILNTVYVNAKSLPQGVKDLVTIKYANCLKAVDDNKKLSAIVAAVGKELKNNLNTDTEETE